MAPDHRDQRLLFVLSSDHGELALALSFCLGYWRPLLLMPERLAALHRGLAAARVATYGTAADVLRAVEREAPDMVFLFSGYLYGINGLLAPAEVERLVQALGVRGVPLLTSDPFLGVLAAGGQAAFNDQHPRKAWLVEHFDRMVGLLRLLPHLYPVPVEPGSHTRNLSFFNPHLLLDRVQARQALDPLVGPLGLDPARPRWIFVMSTEEYGGQLARQGHAEAHRRLAACLDQAVAAGRQPVLVAPPPCAEAMRGRRPAPPGLVALPFCDHPTFMALLLEAEHAFYWNVFSNSVMARAVNHLPVFFFDPGHLARAVPPLHEAGMRLYFPGATLAYLDQREPLSAARLAERAAAQEAALAPARENVRRSPAPPEVLAALFPPGAGSRERARRISAPQTY